MHFIHFWKLLYFDLSNLLNLYIWNLSNIHNKSVVTENGYKSLSDTQSLQCPWWPLQGNPLLMTERNYRTLTLQTCNLATLLIDTSIHCYIAILLRCYIVIMLHFYIAKLPHCHIATILQCFIATLLHWYILHCYITLHCRLIYCYIATSLICYIPSLLHCYVAILQHCDIIILLHC